MTDRPCDTEPPLEIVPGVYPDGMGLPEQRRAFVLPLLASPDWTAEEIIREADILVAWLESGTARPAAKLEPIRGGKS